MLKKQNQANLTKWEKTVTIVEVTDESVKGLVTGNDKPSTIMTFDYEVPDFMVVGDIYLYKDFKRRAPAAPMAPVDSSFWNDRKNFTFEPHQELLLIPNASSVKYLRSLGLLMVASSSSISSKLNKIRT